MEQIKKILQNGAVQIIIVLGGVAITLVNLWITSILTPIKQDLSNLTQSVEAVETKQEVNSELLNRVVIVEQQVTDTREDVKEMKLDIKALLSR